MKTIKVQIKDLYSDKFDREPENNSIIHKHCRKLLKNGEAEDTRLELYRGEMVVLIAPHIGEASKWTLRENKKEGPKFVRFRPRPEYWKKTAN